MIDELIALFEAYGVEKYDENISQTEHAVQCALLARRNNASDELVAAALLHDVGHLLQLQNKACPVSDHKRCVIFGRK